MRPKEEVRAQRVRERVCAISFNDGEVGPVQPTLRGRRACPEPRVSCVERRDREPTRDSSRSVPTLRAADELHWHERGRSPPPAADGRTDTRFARRRAALAAIWSELGRLKSQNGRMGDGENVPVERRRILRKAETQNASLDRADFVDLRDTNASRIRLVPTYVRHSSGPDTLSVKVVKYKKRRGVTSEECSITFDERNGEVSRLGESLGDFLGLIDADRGEHVLLPVGGDLDPVALAGLLSHPDAGAVLANLDLSAEAVRSVGVAARLREMSLALDELEGMLGGDDQLEASYQTWCKAHGWVFGTSYLDPAQLRRVGIHDDVDFLVGSSLNGFYDIVELKRPDHDVLKIDRSRRSYYFSTEVSKAIGQCHRYLDLLQGDFDAAGDHPEIQAHHPRATIVVGRDLQLADAGVRALHGLNARLHGITVITYDQLVRQARRLLASSIGGDGEETGHVERGDSERP